MNQPAATVYLDGRFLPREEARVPVMDRGFLLGDGVYEVIPVYGGRLFRLAAHLDRLERSLAGIRLADPLSQAQWRTTLEELVGRNGGGDLSVYLQVTRGAAPTRDHAFPEQVVPTTFAMATPLTPPPEDWLAHGVACVTAEDIRWQWCHIKAITLLPAVLLRQQAMDQGAQEALLVRDGQVTEGAATNVFAVVDRHLVTPPTGRTLLPGITRDLVLELAAAHHVPYREASLSVGDLLEAQEVWITSSTKEVLPVTRIDGRVVGNGRPGPWFRRMIGLYRDYKEAVRAGREPAGP
jgi:D-alanine transaminase